MQCRHAELSITPNYIVNIGLGRFGCPNPDLNGSTVRDQTQFLCFLFLKKLLVVFLLDRDSSFVSCGYIKCK